MSSSHEKAKTSEIFSNLKTSKPPKSTAGFGAVKASVMHATKYMKPADALKLSLKINQKGGFDCPGCAWPDPDDERSSLGEYCENGMKAITEEAQNKTIGCFYFRHSCFYENK